MDGVSLTMDSPSSTRNPSRDMDPQPREHTPVLRTGDTVGLKGAVAAQLQLVNLVSDS